MKNPINPKTYQELYNIDVEIDNKYNELCERLFEFTNDYQYSINTDIITNQENEEKRLNESGNGSRFYRNFFDDKDFLTTMKEEKTKSTKDKRHVPQLPQQLRYEKKSLLTEEQYNALPDKEKLKVERYLLKNSAIMSARLANIYNRKAHNSQNTMQLRLSQDMFSKKDVYMQEFLISSIRYNEISTQIGLENDHIAFGFSKDSKGNMVLESSLPGFSRFSMHFGNRKNFQTICNNVNNRVATSFNWYKIENEGEFGYNLPTFGIINTGIINADDYSFSHELASQFKQKAKDEEGNINQNGMEEFIYFMNSDLNLNNRELFQLAELAGLGRGFLENLTQILSQKTKMQEQAQKAGIPTADFYVLQRLSQTRNKEDVQALFNGLWNCRKLELSNEVYEEDIEDFKEYLEDLVQKDKNGDTNIHGQIKNFYSQLLEISSSEDIDLDVLNKVDREETAFIAHEQGKGETS